MAELTTSEILLDHLRSVYSRDELATLLQVSHEDLVKYTVSVTSRYGVPKYKYREFEIKKKSGGYRQIKVPAPNLKIIQRQLNKILQEIYKPKPSAHGFLPKKNIITNAQPHVGKSYVFNADIKDFFPSINFGRVYGLFKSKPYDIPQITATMLAQICCYDNSLPQGAPTSPVVSNMICAKMDSQLQKFASKYRCTYTRYADDITLSGHSKRIPEAIAKIQNDGSLTIGDELRQIITGNGFDVNFDKIRLQRKTERQSVTGLTVNALSENYQRPNVKRVYVRQIRAMLHAWEKFGLENAQLDHLMQYRTKQRAPFRKPPRFDKVVEGKLLFLGQVRGHDDKIYHSLVARYTKLTGLNLPLIDDVNALSLSQKAEKAVWVLECDAKAQQGTGIYIADVGLVTCAHVLGTNTYAFQPKNQTIKYPVQIIKQNDVIDLAILKIEAPIEFAFTQKAEPELNIADVVHVCGFPQYKPGNSIFMSSGTISSSSMFSSIKRLTTSAQIIGGCSGGGVLNSSGQLVGIAVTGADDFSHSKPPEFHGIIPIGALAKLT